MIKNIFKQAVFLFLIAFIISLYNQQKIFNISLFGDSYVLGVFDFFICLFLFYTVIEFCILGFKLVIKLIKNDVLISNNAFLSEKESIEVIEAQSKDKIVLSRNQFDEAAILIVKAMCDITSGLMNNARRNLVNLRKIIGDDAIIDILRLKIYKGEKNFDKMEELSKKLMQNEDIQLVGMKAALEAQIEKKEFKDALKTANQAFEVRQDLYWVLSSAFLLRAQNNDWTGALDVLNAGIDKNITPEQKASRLKSVALYELAKQAKSEKDSTKFYKFITQALNENNKLIPAALDLANYYIECDEPRRKAEKVLLDMWRENPCYEVATSYLNLFKETISERVQRMEKLAIANSKRPSLNNILLAELYVKARKFAKAKTECKIFLLKNPATQKVVEILECINTKNTTSKNKKTQKTILEKISNKIGVSGSENINSYPKDFQWVCSNCGKIHNQWEAICDGCGEIGRIYWHLYTDNNALADESEY